MSKPSNNLSNEKSVDASADRAVQKAIAKTPQESRYRLRVPVYPAQVDERYQLKAGSLLKLVDIACSITANLHVGIGKSTVTASLDRTDFISPVKVWEIVTLESQITRVWNTSMEIRVQASSWNFNTHETHPVAVAYLVFVVLDKNRNKIAPAEMPSLLTHSEEALQLSAAADVRKETRIKESREAPVVPINSEEDDFVSLDQVMGPNDANVYQNVFGGVILSLIHDTGRAAAMRHIMSGYVVCARQDRMSFMEPAFIGETVKAMAVVTKTWRTSIEVQVDVSSHNPVTGQIRPVASSYLIYVRLNPERRPAEVPPWLPKTEAQTQRATGADIRRKNRDKEALQPEKKGYEALDSTAVESETSNDFMMRLKRAYEAFRGNTEDPKNPS